MRTGISVKKLVLSSRVSLVAQLIKNPPAMRETWVLSLGWEDSLEKGYPLQYSGLENSVDCMIHGIAKSWTRFIKNWDYPCQHGSTAPGNSFLFLFLYLNLYFTDEETEVPEMMERMPMPGVIDRSGIKSQAFLIPKPKISPLDDPLPILIPTGIFLPVLRQYEGFTKSLN